MSVSYFIDNDADNTKGCPNNVVIIKTPETDSHIFHKLSYTHKMKHIDSVLNLYEPKLKQYVYWMIKYDKYKGGFFDIKSGIEKHPIMQKNHIKFKSKDKIFVDFDRTVTITEGFISNGDKSTSLNDTLKFYQLQGFTGNIEDLISMQMGGINRRILIKKMLNKMIRIVGKSNFIILTNNMLKQTISDFMKLLLGKRVKVISTREIHINKCQYIKTLIT